MPTDGSIITFNQELPVYADKPFISNTLSSSSYKSFGEDIIGATKFYTSINSINDEDVRLSKRKIYPHQDLEDLKEERDQLMEKIMLEVTGPY